MARWHRRLQSLAWLLLVLLVVEFWVPSGWLMALDIATRAGQLALVGSATLAVLLTYAFRHRPSPLDPFGPSFSTVSFSDVTHNIVELSLALVIYVGILEYGQGFTVDRHRRLLDFVINAGCIAVIACLVFVVFLAWTKLTAERSHGGSFGALES